MPRTSVKKIYKVLIRLRLSYASGRDILYGISRYARQHCHWELKLSLDESVGEEHAYPSPGDVDGIITTEPLSNADATSASQIPLVVIGVREPWVGRRMQALTFVRNDDKDIGRYGADYLTHLGRFRSFGFVPTNIPYYCSILRHEGFKSYLNSIQNDVRIYDQTGLQDGTDQDKQALGDWLMSLPKPAAVMAVHDLRATHIIEAAHAKRIRIPSQLAVIGVDNDEIICDSTNPQLTSISPDHVSEGELAAAALDRLMRRKTGNTRPIPLKSKAKTIVERESAAPIAPGVHLAELAMAFIRKNALKGIKARDVAIHLRVSRRLLDLRFNECYQRSILDTIIAIRINATQKRLAASTTPICKIIAACGYPNPNTAKTLFKKTTGKTMSQWRRAHAQFQVRI